MSEIYINIGSNLGERRALIGLACSMLARRLAPARMLLSDFVESEPWGFASPHPFINRGVLIFTGKDIDPMALLDITQDIERTIGHGASHRNADGSYRDRAIDIDIIDIDNQHLNTERLTLPHPHAEERLFVMEPWRELKAML